ncbi:MAG: dihydropteroate synthase [Actinomycetes bacterium]|nr:MAG: dihydropteroate synthase [Actinomycetes bacterium]
MARTAAWRLADRTLELDGPIGVGIVNVTADSMYAGARSGTPERAVADGVALAEAGFEMLDVGAVAARSGPPVAAGEEIERLAPAVSGLGERAGVPVSADTFVPEVAAAAVAAGAVAVNDIGGGADAMLEVVAAAGCGYVLMHIEGPPRVDRPAPRYDDVVDRLKRFFAERIERAVALGVDEEAIAIDPGLDFDLTVADDVEILRRLDELHALGRPLYLSLSRKDFIGALLAGSWEGRLPAEQRGHGTIAAAALAAAKGAQVHRLHDVEALDAIRVAARLRSPRPSS